MSVFKRLRLEGFGIGVSIETPMRSFNFKRLSMGCQRGFSLIELLVFIIVTGLMMSTFMIASYTTLKNTPGVHHQWVAVQVARQCMEWYLDQRLLNGYNALTCPSTPSAAACSAPSGFSVTTNVACTTWSGDANYKTITVTVSGLANASLSTQIGDF